MAKLTFRHREKSDDWRTSRSDLQMLKREKERRKAERRRSWREGGCKCYYVWGRARARLGLGSLFRGCSTVLTSTSGF